MPSPPQMWCVCMSGMARHLASPTLSSTYSGERSQGLEIQSKCLTAGTHLSVYVPLFAILSWLTVVCRIVRYVTVFQLTYSRKGGNDPLDLSLRWISTRCYLFSLLFQKHPFTQFCLPPGRSGSGRAINLQLLPSLRACDEDLTPLCAVALHYNQTEVLL